MTEPQLTPEQKDELMECVRDANNRHFDSGAQRDKSDGKLRMSLIPQQELDRVLSRFLEGAEKYGEHNWKLGMPLSVYYDCMHRHLTAWWSGDDSEDHAAAVVWNMLCAMWTEKNSRKAHGVHDKLDDRWLHHTKNFEQ